MSRAVVFAVWAALGFILVLLISWAVSPAHGQGRPNDPGGCVATARPPVVIPGPRGLDAVHGTVVFACMGNVDEVIVTASLVAGARVVSRTYAGPPPFGIRRRVSAVVPCVRTRLPRSWRTLHSLYARNEQGSDRSAGQSTNRRIRCRMPRAG